MNKFQKILNRERKRKYRLRNPNLLTKYAMILANNSKSISIKPTDITFFCIFTLLGAYYNEVVFSLVQNFSLILFKPLLFIETFFYPIAISFGLITLYAMFREYEFNLFSTDRSEKK